MCGIAGFVFTGTQAAQRAPDPALLKKLTDSIAHRGPDAEGFHIEPGVALGHRRLSIIDVATGQQPMFNEDGSVAVVYNGEIYNFPELITELKALGHVFHTRSDTEVIVHGWEQWGEACVQRFRGMFAFALWDRNRRALFLARDRMGVKPLYYATAVDGAFVFGSELKAILTYPGIDRRIDDSAVEDYFALGYVPDPKSIYIGVRKLAPAHVLRFEPASSAQPLSHVNTPRRYWQPEFVPDTTMTLERATEELRALLTESIQMRLISEVPLGAFLSGGVDSSAVVATMARLSGNPVSTCSIGFSDASVDESEYAREVAELFQTDHFTRIVDSDDYDLVDTLAACYDEPFADSSAIPTYRVSELARTRVTVALSGDGGDETFGGYRRYRLHLAEERVRRALPASIRQPLFGALTRLYPKADWAPQWLRAKTTFAGIASDAVSAYTDSVSVIKSGERNAIYGEDFRRRLGNYRAVNLMHEHASEFHGSGELALVQHLDYRTYLPGDINTKVDRAGMAHSLEVREPLMDHRLVEWAARVPQQLKISGQQGKHVLKESFRGELPDPILFRQKQGFVTPLARWLRGPLHASASSLIRNGEAVRLGFVSNERAGRMLEDHYSGNRDWAAPLWSMLMFEKFLRQLGVAA